MVEFKRISRRDVGNTLLAALAAPSIEAAAGAYPTTVEGWVKQIKSYGSDAYLGSRKDRHAELANDLKQLRDQILGRPEAGVPGNLELLTVFNELLLTNPVDAPFRRILVAAATPLVASGAKGSASILEKAVRSPELCKMDGAVQRVANGLKEAVLLGGENMQEAAAALVSIMFLAKSHNIELKGIDDWERFSWVKTEPKTARGIFQSHEFQEAFHRLELERGDLYLSFARAVAANISNFGWNLNESIEITASDLKKTLDRKIFPQKLSDCTVVIITYMDDGGRIPFGAESRELENALKRSGVTTFHFQPEYDRDAAKNREPEDVIAAATAAIKSCKGPLIVVTNMHGESYKLAVTGDIGFDPRNDNEPSRSFYHALEGYYRKNGESFDELVIVSHSCHAFRFWEEVFKNGYKYTDKGAQLVRECNIPRPAIITGANEGKRILYQPDILGPKEISTMVPTLTALISEAKDVSRLTIRDLMMRLELDPNLSERNDPALILPYNPREREAARARYEQPVLIGL